MMDTPAYFVSDAHLGIEPNGAVPHREERLIEWLRGLRGACSHLAILGDLFEFWYEYEHYIARHHFALYRAFADLIDSGVQVDYLCGNHDFALETFFPELGVRTGKELVLEIQGRRVLITHGDGLPASDKGYRFFRKVLDFPFHRKLFRWIHPDLGMNIARFVGRNSRRLGSEREIQIEEYLEAANRKMKEHRCDLMIHGHHHLQGVWEVEQGQVAACGNWLFSLDYIEMRNGVLSLHTWKP